MKILKQMNKKNWMKIEKIKLTCTFHDVMLYCKFVWNYILIMMLMNNKITI